MELRWHKFNWPWSLWWRITSPRAILYHAGVILTVYGKQGRSVTSITKSTRLLVWQYVFNWRVGPDHCCCWVRMNERMWTSLLPSPFRMSYPLQINYLSSEADEADVTFCWFFLFFVTKFQCFHKQITTCVISINRTQARRVVGALVEKYLHLTSETFSPLGCYPSFTSTLCHLS